LACHLFEHNGNPGPGSELTDIGAKLPRAAIRRTLLNPTAPMPAYTDLLEKDPEKFEDLVDFLAALK